MTEEELEARALEVLREQLDRVSDALAAIVWFYMHADMSFDQAYDFVAGNMRSLVEARMSEKFRAEGDK